MQDKHLSSQFDNDLNELCKQLLEMGGLVEQQVSAAMRAFTQMDESICAEIITREKLVNSKEIEIDSACTELIAKRQPIARDLRLVMAISKAVTNLERVGDEAERIARRTKKIIEKGLNHHINVSEIKLSGEMAIAQLHQSLDSFARLDLKGAAEVMKDDRQIDEEFRAFVRKLISYMMEDPKTISTGLDMMSIAKAIERIGDHAKNIAEFVIYIVEGSDIRHLSSDLISKRN